MKISPTNLRVLIEFEEERKTTDQGVILPDSARKQETVCFAKVLAVGPGVHEGGILVRPWVDVGWRVMLQQGCRSLAVDPKRPRLHLVEEVQIWARVLVE